MVRLANLALCLVGVVAVAAQSSTSTAAPDDDDQQGRNADCNNACFRSSFTGDDCSNDPSCLCNSDRLADYYCCMAEKCEPEVLVEALGTHIHGCENVDLPDPKSLDVKALCTASRIVDSTGTKSANGPDATESDAAGVTEVFTGGAEESTPASQTASQASESADPDSDSGSASLHAGIILPALGAMAAGVGMLWRR